MQSQSSELERTIPRGERVAAPPRSRRLHYWLKDVLDIVIAVATLPEHQRIVVALHHLEGLDLVPERRRDLEALADYFVNREA